jgi:endonuclease YncB( thermonuclease family)
LDSSIIYNSSYCLLGPSLSVSVASVNVDPQQQSETERAAVETLRKTDKKVRFCLVKVDAEIITAIVYANKNPVSYTDLGRQLVRLGIASTVPFDSDLACHKAYAAYYASLIKSEDAASKKKLGMWKEEENVHSSPSFVSRLYRRFSRKK